MNSTRQFDQLSLIKTSCCKLQHLRSYKKADSETTPVTRFLKNFPGRPLPKTIKFIPLSPPQGFPVMIFLLVLLCFYHRQEIPTSHAIKKELFLVATFEVNTKSSYRENHQGCKGWFRSYKHDCSVLSFRLD